MEATRKAAGWGSEKDSNGNSGSSSHSGVLGGGGGEERGNFEFFGWVYHLGTNSIGREYCHLRFLFIRGKYVEMYKRDPHENPGIGPIRRGVLGPTFVVKELGRRRVNSGDLYVIEFYNRLDEMKKGEVSYIFCNFFRIYLLQCKKYWHYLKTLLVMCSRLLA
uniref:Uncharacterized protein n=1 Tax=Rhizophora mucronata TaxID=61149 RepID=A0A2P2LG04_RHIMU